MVETARGGGPEDTHQQGGSTAYVCLLASVAALGGLLFGYDTAVIAGAIKYITIRFQLGPRNVSTCLRHLLIEIRVVWTRFASSFLPMWGPAPTPPGFFQA